MIAETSGGLECKSRLQGVCGDFDGMGNGAHTCAQIERATFRCLTNLVLRFHEWRRMFWRRTSRFESQIGCSRSGLLLHDNSFQDAVGSERPGELRGLHGSRQAERDGEGSRWAEEL